MSRVKKTPFKDYEGGKEVSEYIRLSNYQVEKMSELSSSAFRLYVVLKAHARGKKVFTYPVSLAKPYMSNKTFFVAINELLDKGYITVETSGYYTKNPNIYSFSGEWRKK